MRLTRSFSDTLADRLSTDPGLARALLAEAANAFLHGEAAVARLVLRNLVAGSLDYERLATAVGCSSERLRQMCSKTGNPSMDDLAAIFAMIGKQLGVKYAVEVA